MIKHFLAPFLLGAAAASACFGVHAEDVYPSKPIRLLVGYSPGGSVDAVARLLAQKMHDSLGQPVIVENRPGAAGSLAGSAVAKADPDGYRLLLENSGSFDYALVNKATPYKVLGDFTPVFYIGAAPRLLAVGPSVKAANVAEFFKAARANPGLLTFGTEGNGASSHLAVERLSRLANIRLLHVPFKGGADANTAAAGAQVDLTYLTVATTLPLVRAEKLRPLAVSGLKRSSLLPAVPTFDESGLKGYEQLAWFGVVGPAKMPKDTVEKLRVAIGRAMQMPDVKDALARQGIEIETKSPEEFTTFLRDYSAQMMQVVRDANIKVE